MTRAKYPTSFPTPTVENYNFSVDMGVIRNTMDSGRARQRRRYRTMPTYIGAQFILPLSKMDGWQTWVDTFAYDWFEINLTTFTTPGADLGNCSMHVARFIGDIRYSALHKDVFSVSVEIEVAPLGTFWTPPAGLTDDWIVARTPSDRASDVYEAGSPSEVKTRPTGKVVSGTPSHPAAYV